MEKNFLQDVVPPAQKKSIRNIPIPNGRTAQSQPKTIPDPKIKKPRRTVVSENSSPRITEPRPSSANIPPRKPQSIRMEGFDNHKSSGKKSIFLGGGVILILALLIVLFTFSKAEVTIYPKVAEATVNQTFAVSDMETENDGELSFKSVRIEETVSEEVKAKGEEEVEDKASGKITILNNFSDKPYDLIKNTRFQTSEGLIFRIDHSVVVPGKSGGKPGELEVMVYADGVGEEYNIAPTEFTIPGFKGSEQFDSFSAVSKSKMTGGFVGTRKVIDENDLKATVTGLTTSVKESLISKLNEEVTDEFVVYYDDDSFVFNELPQESESADTVKVSIEGVLTAKVFNKADLYEKLAYAVLTNIEENEEITVVNPDDLVITIKESEEEDGLNLNISGKTEFEWITDFELLTSKLASKNRKDMKDILQEFPSIVRAEAVIKPFWKKSFPSKAEKIKIIEGTD